jgi:hypothetical protein
MQDLALKISKSKHSDSNEKATSFLWPCALIKMLLEYTHGQRTCQISLKFCANFSSKLSRSIMRWYLMAASRKGLKKRKDSWHCNSSESKQYYGWNRFIIRIDRIRTMSFSHCDLSPLFSTEGKGTRLAMALWRNAWLGTLCRLKNVGILERLCNLRSQAKKGRPWTK